MSFEISVTQVSIIAIALPILLVCVFILIIPKLKKGSSSMFRRYLSYLITPPKISISESDLWRKDKVRLYFYYLGVLLFLISFVIGEFYEVMFDLVLPVSQGSTGDVRIVTDVMFQSPFSAGWVGSLPWMGLNAYHESWSWIFFTAVFTDNPNFLSTIIVVLVLISIGAGLAFLSPLAITRFRHSFLPSMFFFMTGMMIFTKAAVGCFANGLALALRTTQLEYGSLVVTGPMIPNLWYVIVLGFPAVLAMFALFIIIGRKLWQVHYSDSALRKWFMVYIALSYWLGLALTMILA